MTIQQFTVSSLEIKIGGKVEKHIANAFITAPIPGTVFLYKLGRKMCIRLPLELQTLLDAKTVEQYKQTMIKMYKLSIGK